jgi:hypothetical protein
MEALLLIGVMSYAVLIADAVLRWGLLVIGSCILMHIAVKVHSWVTSRPGADGTLRESETLVLVNDGGGEYALIPFTGGVVVEYTTTQPHGSRVSTIYYHPLQHLTVEAGLASERHHSRILATDADGMRRCLLNLNRLLTHQEHEQLLRTFTDKSLWDVK